MIRRFLLAVLGLVTLSGCGSGDPGRLGVDAFLKDPPAVVKGKRVGLITNHTGVDSRGRSDIDTIRKIKGVKLVALYAPEHGIRGDDDPGAQISDGVDQKSRIPVFSLYQAKIRKPTPEMLKDVDVLVFDIQDVGARCYTYPYTMANSMEAAKEKGIPFVVLDRPNPIGGEMIESNLLDPKWSTFVGKYAIPMRHGMTVGELAQMFNEHFGIGCDLTVVPVPGWKRSNWWEDTGLKWTPPSPNLPRVESTIHYPGTVAFEGTNLSCGRGTVYPFEQVGAPWMNAPAVVKAMNAAGLSGVRFEAVSFTPMNAGDKKFEGQGCQGIRLIALDRKVYQPVRTSAVLVSTIRALHEKQFQFRPSHFDRLAGTDRLRMSIEQGKLDEFLKTWEADEQTFREMRKPYLMYE